MVDRWGKSACSHGDGLMVIGGTSQHVVMVIDRWGKSACSQGDGWGKSACSHGDR